MTKNNIIDINKYNIKLSDKNKLSLYALIIFCMIVLLFRKKLTINVERVLLFIILLSLLLTITKNWVISLITSTILFLLLNLYINTQVNDDYYEKFDNSNTNDEIKKKLESKKEELTKKIDSSDFINNITEKMKEYQNDKDIQKAANGLQNLLTQIDGGIEIKKSDKEETSKLNVDSEEFKDEDKPDPMKKAQKETYELINMVESLKNTMETLAPVLTQGKEIMNMFENFKM